jgi:hypothetical protein
MRCREGSKSLDGPADCAEWEVHYDDEDVYERSSSGKVRINREAGELFVRIRYRADGGRLGKGILKEEMGFWSAGSPDGDPPSETEVDKWSLDGVLETSPEEFLRVCERSLLVDLEGIYSEFGAE